jgi:hypothetical protein
MRHPLTGEPLAVKHLELPPGSMVSIPAHMPHYVAPRERGACVRACRRVWMDGAQHSATACRSSIALCHDGPR